MCKDIDDFTSFVIHPRYGQGPQKTGLNPKEYINGDKLNQIENTAVIADLSRQLPGAIPVLFYCDLKRICRDCKKPFIFFAEEQKYWYEELCFEVYFECVKCVDCRKQDRNSNSNAKRFEELSHISPKTIGQILEMAECCLSLIEASRFHMRQTQHVRRLLNQIPVDSKESIEIRKTEIQSRLIAIEKN